MHGLYIGAAMFLGVIITGTAAYYLEGWKLSDALSDGKLGYARYDFSYISNIPGSAGTRVYFAGISQVRLAGGLIARYGEMFDRGTALVQMNFEPERIARSLKRWAEEQKPAEK